MARKGGMSTFPKRCVSPLLVLLPCLSSAKDIKGETRLAVTTHESADVGVCLRNYLECESALLATLFGLTRI
jgi:hypothetical protein